MIEYRKRAGAIIVPSEIDVNQALRSNALGSSFVS
jgi:hypothetical protein